MITHVKVTVSMNIGMDDFREQRRWLLEQEENGAVEASGISGIMEAIADAILEKHPRLKC